MAWKGNMVVGRRPVSLFEAYTEDQIVNHIADAETRIAELEAALHLTNGIEPSAFDREQMAKSAKRVAANAARLGFSK